MITETIGNLYRRQQAASDRYNAHTLTLIVTICWIGFLVYLAVIPSIPETPISLGRGGASLGHFGAHLVLVALTYLLSSPLTQSLHCRIRAAIIAIGVSTTLGVGLEGVQILVADRTAQVSDILFNALGALTGLAIVLASDLLNIRRGHLVVSVGGVAGAIMAFVIVSDVYSRVTVPYVEECRTDDPAIIERSYSTLLERQSLLNRAKHPTRRVTEDLLLLYAFEEGEGTIIHDVSGAREPLDLHVADMVAVRWVSGGLVIDSATIIEARDDATDIISALVTTNEITIEVWAKPANATQFGPARIVTLSCDTARRNFTLGQRLLDNDSSPTYDVRLRTTETTRNGIPSLPSSAGTVETALTHITYTRDAAGNALIYTNGIAGVTQNVRGDFSNWDGRYRLALANEWTLDRPWLGELHLVAIYDRALSSEEVGQNFNAGPDSNP